MVQIEGRMITVPADEPTLYFSAAYSPDPKPFPVRIHVTAEPGTAWDFLCKTLVPGGRGHVIEYDMRQAETEEPIRVGCLGRLDNIDGQIVATAVEAHNA
jgi:hypothetical protein